MMAHTTYALSVSGDSLYVGGYFVAADNQPDSSLAVWNGADWNPVAANGFNGPVYALTADGNGGVYAGGNFDEVAGVTRANLVHWNGSSFGTVASGVNNTVESLATDETALYAGGWFTEAGNAQTISLHFAALDGAGAAVSAGSTPMGISFSIYPNPTAKTATVSLALAKAGTVRLELFNGLGIKIAIVADGSYAAGSTDFSFDASTLTKGIYFLRLTENGSVTSESFVVE